MNEELVFYEQQRFSRSWRIVLIVLIDALFIYGCILQLGMGKQWGDNPMSNTVLLITAVLLKLLTVSFFFAHLDTVINKEGIYVKLFPFFLKYRFFSWDMISEFYVRKYNPILEYGGWGVRKRFSVWKIKFGLRGIRRRGMKVAYVVSGTVGLQLELTNGKRVLIGTRNPVEMEEVLQKLHPTLVKNE